MCMLSSARALDFCVLHRQQGQVGLATCLGVHAMAAAATMHTFMRPTVR
jgi:hypothetical protein